MIKCTQCSEWFHCCCIDVDPKKVRRSGLLADTDRLALTISRTSFSLSYVLSVPKRLRVSACSAADQCYWDLDREWSVSNVAAGAIYPARQIQERLVVQLNLKTTIPHCIFRLDCRSSVLHANQRLELRFLTRSYCGTSRFFFF
jgi:hypothetical protein